MAVPQYTVNGHATKPTRRSATAMDNRIKLEGDDRRFFRGSFQTDKMTNALPNTMIGDIMMATTETVADMVLALSTRNHTLFNASSLVIFQKLKWPAMAAMANCEL